MKFSVEIEMGNEGMQSFQDLRDALKQVATKLGSRQHCSSGAPNDGDGSKVMDVNGNAVGEWSISANDYEEEEEEGNDDHDPENIYGTASMRQSVEEDRAKRRR